MQSRNGMRIPIYMACGFGRKPKIISDSIITISERSTNNLAATWQNQQSDCAPSEDSDQPGHPPSLIRVLAVRMKKPLVLSYPLSAQRMPRLIWVFLGSHSFCWFCHEAAQFRFRHTVSTVEAHSHHRLPILKGKHPWLQTSFKQCAFSLSEKMLFFTYVCRSYSFWVFDWFSLFYIKLPVLFVREWWFLLRIWGIKSWSIH